MKKLFSLFLVILLLLTALPCAALAETHTHDFIRYTSVYPTCTTPGLALYQCRYCDYSYNADIPALGHYYPLPWTTVKNPTCTEEGVEMNICQRKISADGVGGRICGYTWYRPLPALGHEMGPWYIVSRTEMARDCVRDDLHENVTAHLDASVTSVSEDGKTATVSFTVTNTGSGACNAAYVLDTGMGGLIETQDRGVYNFGAALLSAGQSVSGSMTLNLTDKERAQGYAEITLIAIVHPYPIQVGTSVDSNTVCLRVELGSIEEYALKISNLDITKVEDHRDTYGNYRITYNVDVTNTGEKDLYARINDFCENESPTLAWVLHPIDAGQTITVNNKCFSSDEAAWEDGKVWVRVCATGYSPEDPNGDPVCTSNTLEADADLPRGEGKDSDPLKLKASIVKYCVSAPANGIAYTEGETVTYLVQLVCAEDKEATVIEVYDYLYGENGGYLATDIPMKPASWTYDYTVTHDDALAGSIINQASALYIDDDDTFFIASDAVIVRTECSGEPDAVKAFFIKNETSVPANGAFYTEGETIRYEIVFGNDTAYTFEHITVSDKGELITKIDKLLPEETSGSLIYEYTVTKADCERCFALNQASAEYTVEDKGSFSACTNTVVSLCGTDSAASVSCRYIHAGKGVGAEVYLNVYCPVHRTLDAACDQLIESLPGADGYLLAAELWTNELDRLYGEAYETFGEDALTDCAAAKDYIDALRVFTSTAAGDEAGARAAWLLARDRACGMCAVLGNTCMDGPETIECGSNSECVYEYTDSDLYYQLEARVCSAHQTIARALNEVLNSMDEKAIVLNLDRFAAYWGCMTDFAALKAGNSADADLLKNASDAYLSAHGVFLTKTLDSELLAAQSVLRLSMLNAVAACAVIGE